MWGFPNNIPKIRLRKSSTEPNLACSDFSDDDVGSSASREEGLECPICWESFNIVENIPYVLWCGHTLCRNCVLGLQCAVMKLPAEKFKIPFFVSCPWCSLLSFRFSYKGNLKFPRKNYFILWMIESLNGDRTKSSFSLRGENQSLPSPRRNSLLGNHPFSPRRAQTRGRLGTSRSSGSIMTGDSGHVRDYINGERPQFSLHKSLDYFLHLAAKFPLVVIFLLILFLVIPGSAAILVLYLLITVLLAVPSVLVLYFSYPMMEWLVREITS